MQDNIPKTIQHIQQPKTAKLGILNAKLPGILLKEGKIYADYFDESIMERITELRKKTLIDNCLKKSITTKDNLFRFDIIKNTFSEDDRPRLLVSDQHKTVYCAIGRTGSENWERIIERMEMGFGKSEGEFDQRFAGAPTLRWH